MSKFKTFSDALTAIPVAANDNKPVKQRKQPEPRYRGTLPALRWLYDNHPELAPAMADAVQSLSVSNWDPEASDSVIEIRPTIGELMRAATNQDTGETHTAKIETDSDGNTSVRLGALRFERGELVEYGRTAKGRKLEPRDRLSARTDEPSTKRNPNGYVFWLRGAVASPMRAESYQRPISSDPALPPMYDPQKGVEANRSELRRLGVDGSVAFDDLPFPAIKCPLAIAKGAEFLGGVVQMSGNSSSGAVMWEANPPKRGEAMKIVEAVAAGATLKDIGEQLGLKGARVDRTAKDVLIDAAKALMAANDNYRKKKAA